MQMSGHAQNQGAECFGHAQDRDGFGSASERMPGSSVDCRPGVLGSSVGGRPRMAGSSVGGRPEVLGSSVGVAADPGWQVAALAADLSLVVDKIVG